MSVGMKVSFVVVIAGQLILGMLGNGFIGLVNCTEWVKTRKISSADFILTSLAMARIIQLWVTIVDASIMGLAPHLYASGELEKVVIFVLALTNHLTTWFATCLSIFYFLKIANFSHFIFIWLKWRVNKVVLVLFLGSFFLLSVNLLMEDALSELWKNAYRVHERNMTLPLDVNKMLYLKSFLLLNLAHAIPFFLSLSSLLLLFLSLVRHTKNLKLNLTGSWDTSSKAHRRAMKMLTTFIFLFVIYFISKITASWSVYKIQSSQGSMIGMVISTLFPSGHSFIIILGNNKLRQRAMRYCGILNSPRKAKPLTL